MRSFPNEYVTLLGVAVWLAACAPPAKKADVMDMYELPRSTVPVDNDSYYTQPAVYKGCLVINDAPSCGGG